MYNEHFETRKNYTCILDNLEPVLCITAVNLYMYISELFELGSRKKVKRQNFLLLHTSDLYKLFTIFQRNYFNTFIR